MTRPNEARAWAREAAQYVGEDCLLWPFAMARGGYGTVRDGRKLVGAHRLVCELAHGAPPESKLDCAHSCGVRRCCNPRHLRWATRSENCADKVLHGTDQAGERHGMSKLTEAEVRTIRALAGTAFQRVIASRFGVSRENIGLIISRKGWAHLEGEQA